MKSRVESNLKSRLAARGVALVLPAAFSIFALVGVTVRPTMGIAEARVALRAAQARTDEVQTQRELLFAFEQARGFERVEATLERVRDPIPEQLEPVTIYGLMRVSAESSGVELLSLHQGAETDLELDGPRDRVVSTDVAVSGDGTLSSIVSLVDTLRGLGLPTIVRDVSIDRTNPADVKFHFRMTLGLIHFAPHEETDDSDSGDGEYEGGAEEEEA